MICECNLHQLSGNTSGLAAVAEIGLETCIQLVVRAVTGYGGHEYLWCSLLIDLVSLKVFPFMRVLNTSVLLAILSDCLPRSCVISRVRD